MTPQNFEVVVRGRVSSELVGALDGFAVSGEADGCTRMVGEVADQPRLIGVLQVLDDLHIEVVSVNPLDGGTPPA